MNHHHPIAPLPSPALTHHSAKHWIKLNAIVHSPAHQEGWKRHKIAAPFETIRNNNYVPLNRL